MKSSLLINEIEKYFNEWKAPSINDEKFKQIVTAVKNLKVSDDIHYSNLEFDKKTIIINRFEAYLKYINSKKIDNAQFEIIKAIQELKEIAAY